MYNPDTELLFPTRVIPTLRDLRGKTWQDLVARVVATDEHSIEQLTFVAMMVRLNSCATCNADSYRAMQGCADCAKQSLKRYRGSDEDIFEIYQTTRLEVEQYLQKKI